MTKSLATFWMAIYMGWQMPPCCRYITLAVLRCKPTRACQLLCRITRQSKCTACDLSGHKIYSNTEAWFYDEFSDVTAPHVKFLPSFLLVTINTLSYVIIFRLYVCFVLTWLLRHPLMSDWIKQYGSNSDRSSIYHRLTRVQIFTKPVANNAHGTDIAANMSMYISNSYFISNLFRLFLDITTAYLLRRLTDVLRQMKFDIWPDHPH